MTEAMTVTEKAELAELEAVIESGLQTFAEVGNALLAIRDGKKYRAEYGTFEAYCKDRWGFNASRARQLIGAAVIVARLESVTIVTPATESQARPLARLAPKEQPEAWKGATEKAESEGRRVTARDVEEQVEERTEKKEEQKRHKGNNSDYRRMIELIGEITAIVETIKELNLPNSYRPEAVAMCETLKVGMDEMTEHIRRVK